MRIAIVGTRECTSKEYRILSAISCCSVMIGCTVVTGEAPGSDDAARAGAEAICKELNLTLKEYLNVMITRNGHRGFYVGEHSPNYDTSSDSSYKAATMIASKFHPMMKHMDKEVLISREGLSKKQNAIVDLMTRNVFQICGQNLTNPVEVVVICATGTAHDMHSSIVDAAGGTGQAVRIAASMGIPILNIRDSDFVEKITNFYLDKGLRGHHLDTIKETLEGINNEH